MMKCCAGYPKRWKSGHRGPWPVLPGHYALRMLTTAGSPQVWQGRGSWIFKSGPFPPALPALGAAVRRDQHQA